MSEQDIWRPVVGYEGRYEVSDHGRVRSLPIVVKRPGVKPFVHPGSGRVLQQSSNQRGYKLVELYCGSRATRRTRPVHRLVCEAFHGPPPEDKPNTLHNDGKPDNNRAVNLRWGSQADNFADAKAHGVTGKGEAHSQVKLTDAQVAEVRHLARARVLTASEISRRFGICQRYVHKLKAGEMRA